MEAHRASIVNEEQCADFSGYAVRENVAVILSWRNRIALFKRSEAVAHDAGKWHCITGYLGRGVPPIYQAVQEVWEETGLRYVDFQALKVGPILRLTDESGLPWHVHTFLATTTRRRLSLDWEHVAYRWVRPRNVPRFTNQVNWLAHVIDALPPIGE